MDRRFRLQLRTAILLIGIIVFWGRTAARGQGGPPMITDDPGTPPAGHWEVNVGANGSGDRGSSQEWQLPQVDLNYGCTDRLYIKYESAWRVNHQPGIRGNAGWDDSIFGFKWAIPR
jgi:hypothetical protein